MFNKGGSGNPGKDSQKEDETYQVVASAEELARNYLNSTKEVTSDGEISKLPAKKTKEELLEDIKATKVPIGKTTLLYRRVRLNTDLALIGLIVAFAGLTGFSLKGFQWNRFLDYAHIVISAVLTVIAVIWRIHTPPGMISQSCIDRGQKGKGEVDAWGKSITGPR